MWAPSVRLGPVHIIPGQLITPGQLTDPGVNFASVHGLTPVTVHMSFSLPRGNFERRVTCYTIFLLTGLRIYTVEYKAQGPTLCPTEERALRGPRALYSPV